MATTKTRLAKIETALKLCEWCEFEIEQDEAFYAALRAQGVQRYQANPGEVRKERCESCGRQVERISVPELQAELAALNALEEVGRSEGRKPCHEDWKAYVTYLENALDFYRRIYGADVFDKAFAETAWPDYLDILREEMAKAPSREEPTP